MELLPFILILVFLFSAALMHFQINVFNITRITLPATFYLTYLVMIFFPSIWVYYDQINSARDDYILGVASVLLTTPLGIYLINKLYSFNKKEINSFYTAPVLESISPQRSFPFHFIFSIFALCLACYYFYSIPSIPVLELMGGLSNPAELALSREMAFKLLDPRWEGDESTYLFYAYLFLRTLVFPVLIVSLLGYALYTKRLKWALLFLAVFFVGSFYAVSQLSRAPIAAIIMRLAVFCLLFYRGNISTKTLIVIGAIMLIFPLIVTMSYVVDYTVLDALKAVFIRLTYTPAEDLYYYFEIFPNEHDFLYGQTLIKPFLKLLEFDYFYIENYVALYISPWGLDSAHANAAFVSNFYADFGIPGVLIGGTITGALIQWIQIFLFRRQKSIYNMTIFAFSLYAIWVLNFGSLTSVLFVNGLIPIFIFVFVIKGIVNLTPKLLPRNSQPLTK
jgi:oligosaccharide repeat unit polymerase